MDIHDRIKIRRKELRLSSADLGEAGGVSYQAAQQWELSESLGGTAPARHRMVAVADRLKLTLSCLLTGDGWEARNVPIPSASGEIKEVPAIPDATRLAHEIFTLIRPFLEHDGNNPRFASDDKVFLGIEYPPPRGSTKTNDTPNADLQTQPDDTGHLP